MILKPWQNIENVVVVGLGLTGASVVRHLLSLPKSLKIKVIDTRDKPPGSESLPKNVELVCGGWPESWLIDIDLIVVNPGIALSTLNFNKRSMGIPVIGDIELFAWQVDKPVLCYYWVKW